MNAYVITHLEAMIAPTVPVGNWPLSEQGRQRIRVMLRQPWLQRIRFIVSSDERMPLDAAEMPSSPTAQVRQFGKQAETDLISTGNQSPGE